MGGGLYPCLATLCLEANLDTAEEVDTPDDLGTTVSEPGLVLKGPCSSNETEHLLFHQPEFRGLSFTHTMDVGKTSTTGDSHYLHHN